MTQTADIVRTQQEIDSLADKCLEAEETGSKYPGMTYEQGIRDTLDWLQSDDFENPLENDDD